MHRKLTSPNGRAYLSGPGVANIQLTRACPLFCSYCYVSKVDKNSVSLEQLRKWLHELSDLGCKSIVYSGGEPLIYPNIHDAIKMAKDYGQRVRISTSGAGLTYDKLRDIHEAGLDKLEISLNSTVESVNQLSRDGYELAVNAIKLTGELKQEFAINYVAQESNVKHFGDLASFAEKNGASAINILREKVNESGSIGKSLSIADMTSLASAVENSTVPIMIEECFCELLLLTRHRPRSPLQGCAAGRVLLSISADGLFRPCPHLETKGERCDSIGQYWSQSPMLMEIRNVRIKDQPCKNCVNVDKCDACQALFPDERTAIHYTRPMCSFYSHFD